MRSCEGGLCKHLGVWKGGEVSKSGNARWEGVYHLGVHQVKIIGGCELWGAVVRVWRKICMAGCSTDKADGVHGDVGGRNSKFRSACL